MSAYGNLQTKIRLGPECSIQIYNPSNPKRYVEIDAIVDSGAVATCIPEQTILEIGNLVRDDDVFLKDANNNRLSRKTYYIGIKLSNFQADIARLRIVSIPDKKYAVIGRDIINEYKIALDARNRAWQLNCGGMCNQVDVELFEVEHEDL